MVSAFLLVGRKTKFTYRLWFTHSKFIIYSKKSGKNWNRRNVSHWSL